MLWSSMRSGGKRTEEKQELRNIPQLHQQRSEKMTITMQSDRAEQHRDAHNDNRQQIYNK